MFKQLFIEVEILDSKKLAKFYSTCAVCNRGTEYNPDVTVEEQVNGTCEHNNAKYIHFTAYKVPIGNYSIKVRAVDDRCLPGTIWTESGHCWREKLVNGTASNDDPVVSMTNDALMWILIFTAVILFHAVLISWFLIRRKKQLVTEVQSDSIPLREKKYNVNLLLLYPRDCFHFMKTMSSFRRLLGCLDNVEVYDCYAVEDELFDPLDWLMTVFHHPRLYIIVVTSPCAHSIQEKIKSSGIENSCEIYRNPSYLDPVFIYGLKLIMKDFSSDVYQRIHIIGFQGFSDDNRIISLPSSLRRYNIPEHLDTLLLEMSLEYKRGGSLQYSPEYISLRNNITNLRNYKRQNPGYLSEVLNE